jgi:hypothetical protein
MASGLEAEIHWPSRQPWSLGTDTVPELVSQNLKPKSSLASLVWPCASPNSPPSHTICILLENYPWQLQPTSAPLIPLINRSLSKWLLGCAISPSIFALPLLLCASSLFNSFHTVFSSHCSLSRVQLTSPFVPGICCPICTPTKYANLTETVIPQCGPQVDAVGRSRLRRQISVISTKLRPCMTRSFSLHKLGRFTAFSDGPPSIPLPFSNSLNAAGFNCSNAG